MLRIREGRSSLRFRKGDSLAFVVKLTVPENDPRYGSFDPRDPTRFGLYQLEAERDERRLVLTEQGLLSANTAPGAYLIRIRPYGQTSWMLTPAEPLSLESMPSALEPGRNG